MKYPKKHISIRVPWHDSGWDGRVCANPRLNGACLKLKRIGQERNDIAEEAVAGQSLADLLQEKWPCCVAERVAFMSPFEYTRVANHPYKHTSEGSHGHFAPPDLRHPAYSAPAVPFAWMLRESMDELGETYGLDVRPQREPELGFSTQWIQAIENQKALSDCFCDHIKPEESLCFFYAKQVPFVEDAGARRILIGVGRVLHVSPGVEYQYSTRDLKGKLRSMLWERMVQHSIRPDFKDGFLLPYHAALELAADNPDFDPASIAAFSPDDRLLEFSHASQLVTHDAAIASLLSCAESLRKAVGVLPGPWAKCLTWIDHRVGELWTARGPCPGLASALCAFGIDLGTFIARQISDNVGENVDPWPMVDQVLRDPQKHLPKDLAKGIGTTIQAKWNRLPEERRNLLKLISRFEINREQATTIYVQEERKKANIDCSDLSILTNPYLLYETTRLTSTPIGGTWNTIAGQPTDDSEMALLLARMLVKTGSYDPKAARKEYQYWLSSDPFDCGMTISAGLRGNPNPDSQANGAMMRISPLGIFGAGFELNQVAEWAMQDAALTHPNLICQQANALFAMGIAHAIQSGCDRKELYRHIRQWAADMPVEPALLDTIDKAANEPPADYVHQQGWVLIAFQNALYQLLHAPSLEEGVVNTIMRGGDTDTNAAICGALLGAVCGREAIPAQWLDCLQNCRPEAGNPRVRHPRPECFWPVDVLELAEKLIGNRILKYEVKK